MRSTWKYLGILLAAGGLALLPTACGDGGSAKPRVGIISNNNAEFWSFAEAGAQDAAKEFDVDVSFRKPAKGEVSEQMDILNTFKNGFSGVAISVIDPEEQSAELKLLSKSMNVITMDNDAPNSNRICYVGTDNYNAGKSVGRLVKEAMPEGGTIAIFVGQIAPLNARERFQGVVDELAGSKDAKGPTFGKYTLYRNEPITDGASREVALENAKAALATIGNEPNVCLIGLWAYNVPTCLEAAKGKGLQNKVRIVGFDEDAQTLEGIAEGFVHGTVVQNPYLFGFRSVEILAAEARGDQSKRAKKPVPHRVITQDGHVPNGEDESIEGLSVAAFRESLSNLRATVK